MNRRTEEAGRVPKGWVPEGNKEIAIGSMALLAGEKTEKQKNKRNTDWRWNNSGQRKKSQKQRDNRNSRIE
ncbi:hypothetical protein AVEN_128499-1, partial [Araneus ventricosus]